MSQNPIALEDLDREELLQLLRNVMPLRVRGPSEFLWVKWTVACRRADAALDAISAQSRATSDLLKPWDAADRACREALASGKYALIKKATLQLEKASAAYHAARDEEKRLEAKWDRLCRQRDRLYKQQSQQRFREALERQGAGRHE